MSYDSQRQIKSKEELIAYLIDVIQVQKELDNLIQTIRKIQNPALTINLSFVDQ